MEQNQGGKKYQYRIERDQWGVPHIWGKTDADAVYGLAQARAEDQFASIQEGFMTIKGRSAEMKGIKGIGADILVFLVFADCKLEEARKNDLSSEFITILEAAKNGLNDFAQNNRDKVQFKDLFPISEIDILKGYILFQTFTSGAIYELGKVAGNRMEKLPSGSNSFCYSGKVMNDGIPTLISNVHQPIEGPWSFYEAHLCSNQGWNIVGAVYTPAITPLLGVTPHHSWTYTNNYAKFWDTCKLEINPNDKNEYRIDNEYEILQPIQFKTKVHLGQIRIPFKRTFYRSKFGVTIKNKKGYFAVNFSAKYAIKAAEQYYRMGKAKTLSEFKQALNMQGLACQNILYLDKNDNQFMISNGLFPFRDQVSSSNNVLEGTSAKNIWTPVFHPLTDLPQLENPSCGILYNTNNPPFFATQPNENLNAEDFDPTFGFILKESNRGLRFRELLQESQNKKLNFAEVMDWKYDRQFASETLYTFFLENLEELLAVCDSAYPDLQPGVVVIKKWNKRADKDNKQASFFAILCYYMVHYLEENFRMGQCNKLTERVFVSCFRKTQKHMIRHFGTLELPLSEVQFLVRGQQEIPIGGLPENIAATFCTKHKNGKIKMDIGDSYIFAVRYSQPKVKVESVVPFGSSENPESPHYADQMALFASNNRKTMDLYFFDHLNQTK